MKGGRGYNVKYLPYAFTIRDLMNPPEPTKRTIGFIELEEKKR